MFPPTASRPPGSHRGRTAVPCLVVGSVGRHRRGSPLLRVVSRVWLWRDARLWTVHGRDQRGRSISVQVGLAEFGVTLTPSRSGQIELAPLQAGKLRNAIKNAVIAVDSPRAAVREMPPSLTPRPRRQPWPPSPRPRVRVSVDVGPATEPLYAKHLLAYFGTENNYVHHDDSAAGHPEWPEHDADEERHAAGVAA